MDKTLQSDGYIVRNLILKPEFSQKLKKKGSKKN